MNDIVNLNSIDGDALVPIFIGICIIIFGYWLKPYMNRYYKSSVYLEESLNRIREMRKLDKLLTLNEKIHLLSTDDCSILVKIIHRVGYLIIIIGLIILVI